MGSINRKAKKRKLTETVVGLGDESLPTKTSNEETGLLAPVAVVTEQMKFFKKPEVGNGLLRSFNVYVDAQCPLDITSDRDVIFNVPGNTTNLIDLQEIELLMEIQIRKKGSIGKGNMFANGPGDKTLITKNGLTFPECFIREANENADPPDDKEAEFVTPIDAFFHTQWENIEIKLNDKTITRTNNDQPYRSYIDLLLRTEDKDLPLCERKFLFTRNRGRKRKNDPHPYSSENIGAIKRSLRVRSRNIVQLGGKIFTDFLKDPEILLVNGVSMFFRFSPASNKFRFKVYPDELKDKFEYVIHSCKLKIPYVTLTDGALGGMTNYLKSQPVYYKYVETDMKILPLHEGVREVRIPEIFHKIVPIDVVFAMVDADSAYGANDKDPFYFNQNNIESLSFRLDNTSIPEEPLEFPEQESSIIPEDDHISERADEWQYRILESLWNVAGTTENGFNAYTYEDGQTLIAVKTDPTVPANVTHWPIPKGGNLSLHIRFRQAIPNEQQLIVFARYPRTITIDYKRKVKVW